MGSDVKVMTVAERPTAVVAAVTTWQEFPARWKPMLDQVYACLRRHGSARQGCNVMFYRDDPPYAEVGVELISPCALDHPVVRSALPGGETAMTVHRGPYENLGAAHAAVTRWCADAGDLWRLA
jgi:effector-binding domain-containing protein